MDEKDVGRVEARVGLGQEPRDMTKPPATSGPTQATVSATRPFKLCGLVTEPASQETRFCECQMSCKVEERKREHELSKDCSTDRHVGDLATVEPYEHLV